MNEILGVNSGVFKRNYLHNRMLVNQVGINPCLVLITRVVNAVTETGIALGSSELACPSTSASLLFPSLFAFLLPQPKVLQCHREGMDRV